MNNEYLEYEHCLANGYTRGLMLEMRIINYKWRKRKGKIDGKNCSLDSTNQKHDMGLLEVGGWIRNQAQGKILIFQVTISLPK